jgi:hypothetical protein
MIAGAVHALCLEKAFSSGDDNIVHCTKTRNGCGCSLYGLALHVVVLGTNGGAWGLNALEMAFA